MIKHYALIKDSLVSNVILLEDPTENFLEEVRLFNNVDLIVLVPEKFLNFPYAISVGYAWDGTTLIPPKPFNSWILNEEKDWTAPVSKPNDNNAYVWNEETIGWDLIEEFNENQIDYENL